MKKLCIGLFSLTMLLVMAAHYHDGHYAPTKVNADGSISSKGILVDVQKFMNGDILTKDYLGMYKYAYANGEWYEYYYRDGKRITTACYYKKDGRVRVLYKGQLV